jgi:hypothetical protein
MSEYQQVCCPRCDKQIADYELKEYLTKDEIAEIEKN